MGFIKDVREIVRALPERRQTLLFSATISTQVKHLAERLQRDSVLIEIGEQHNPVETVTQHVYPTARDKKLDLLRTILEEEHMEKCSYSAVDATTLISSCADCSTTGSTPPETPDRPMAW